MTSVPPVKPWGWKEFYAFSENLIQECSLEKQCGIIQLELQKHVGGKSTLWMSDVFRPLPGESIPECIEYGAPSKLISKCLKSRRVISEGNFHPPKKFAIPLLVQTRIIGAFEIEFPQGTLLLPQTLDFINGFSAHCALALHVSRQTAVNNRRYEQLALLRTINLQIARQREDASLFQNVVKLIQNAFHFYFVALYTFNDGDQKLHFRASSGTRLNADQVDDLILTRGIPLGNGLVGKAAKQRREVVSPNVHRDTRFRAVNGLENTCSEVSIPLLIEGRLLGILDLQSDQENAFHENDLIVLRILADNVAAAVDGNRLVEALSHHADHLAAVSEVSRLLVSILDMDELLQQVVSIISQKFNYPFVHFFVLDSSRKKIIFENGTGALSKTLRKHEFSFDLYDSKGIVPFVARKAETYIANHVNQDPIYRENPLPPAHTQAEMAVPLIYNDEVMGVLDIQSDQANAFNEEDQFTLEGLAATISVALRNATLYRTESWRRQVAEGFKDIAGLFSSQFTLEVIFQTILKELIRNLHCNAAAIWLINQDSDRKSGEDLILSEVAGDVVKTEVLESQMQNIKIMSWLHKVLKSDQPVVRKSEREIEPLGWAKKFPSDYSAIATPILATDHPLGIILLVNKEPDRFGSEAISMLSTFAGYTSIAIQNNQLYTSSVRQAWISTVMLQVAEAVQSAENTEALLSGVARIIPLLIGVNHCAFYLWDKFASVFSWKAQEGFDEINLKGIKEFPLSQEGMIAFKRIHKGRPLANLSYIFQETQKNKTKKKKESQFIMLPLRARGELLGAFLVENNHTGHLSDIDQQVNVLQSIAQQTAVGLENIQLKEFEQSEAYVTAVLLQVAQTAASSKTLHETFETIATILPLLVGVETVLIYQYEPEKDLFHLRGSFSEKWEKDIKTLNKIIKSADHPLLNELKLNHKILFFNHHDFSPVSWGDKIKPESGISNLKLLNDQETILFALPMVIRNELFGALLVAESSTNIAFREKRFEIIRDVAQQLALAVQSDQFTKEIVEKERLQREMQLANEIQRTFLPDVLPLILDWEVDVHWHPAKQVSGDFYDVFQLPDGRFGFVIADVSDKGIPAALYMTVTRTLVHASAMDGEPPAKTLYQVNKILVENSREGLFTTAFYCLLDLKTNTLTYCNAGHNLPIWLHAKIQKTEYLEKGGTALGALSDIYLCDTEIIVQPNDCLLLYTDGVTEARGAKNKLYGMNRLKKFIQKEFNKPVNNILDDLDSELARFRENELQSDDITTLGIRRLR